MKALRDSLITVAAMTLAVLAWGAGLGYRGALRWTYELGLPDVMRARIVDNAPTAVEEKLLELFIAAAAPAVVATLVFFWPSWALLAYAGKRRPSSWSWKVGVVWALVGVVAVAVVLSLVHPILSLRKVPPEPRKMLNLAFEVIGYAWVNAMSYATAMGGAVLFGWLRAGRQLDVDVSNASTASGPAARTIV